MTWRSNPPRGRYLLTHSTGRECCFEDWAEVFEMSSLSMYIQISVAQFTIAEPAGPPEADGEETETGRRRLSAILQ